MPPHFSPRGSFSGFGDGWVERLCHTSKVSSPVPSALATLPLTTLATFSQKRPVGLDRHWGQAGQLGPCNFLCFWKDVAPKLS